MANTRKPDDQSSIHSSEGRESVLALEVPLSSTQCYEDEMISWLQYPLEDSFDKNYCSEELYPEGAKSHSDVVHNAFSNLTLREATHTWGVGGLYDTKKNEKILAANMAMAMGAQRAAGLLSQSGVDTFNMVRTNAQPLVAKSMRNRMIEEASGSASNVFKVENQGSSSRRVTGPNFTLFSRAGGVTGMSSEHTAYDNSKAILQAKPGFIRHAGGGSSASSGNQTPRVATHTIQPRPLTVPDTPMITRELSSMCLLHSRSSGGTGRGFSRLPSQHSVRLETSNEIMKHFAESITPPSISLELEAEAGHLMTHIGPTPRTLASQQTRRGLISQSAPAISSGIALGASAGSSGKRVRAEAETSNLDDPSFGAASTTVTGMDLYRQSKIARSANEENPTFVNFRGSDKTINLLSQDDPSFGAASTMVTDSDSYRQSKIACFANETNFSCVDSRVFGSSDIDSKELCSIGTVSGITTLDSQIHETVGTDNASMASPSRAWGGSTPKSFKEAAATSTKRKALSCEDSEIEWKDFKDEKLLQGRGSGAKGTQAADSHVFEREWDFKDLKLLQGRGSRAKGTKAADSHVFERGSNITR